MGGGPDHLYMGLGEMERGVGGGAGRAEEQRLGLGREGGGAETSDEGKKRRKVPTDQVRKSFYFFVAVQPL